ncbi:MAG: DNA glycosylase [Candidatus Borkfalkiaceae bacterium]|nr:DNA glycosylase [Christensenellaceae bacterium]
MTKIITEEEFFNVKDTLECGQIFRFKPFEKGYLVFSKDRACYACNENGKAIIECKTDDEEYFRNFFDLSRDYSSIYSRAKKSEYDIVSLAAEAGKGIRILNQDKTETLFSFLTSQNNRIPRIKSIIERTCAARGVKNSFSGEEYYSFPLPKELFDENVGFYNGLGYGYRSDFIRSTAKRLIENADELDKMTALSTKELKESLMSFKGVGPKVADCVSLFAYHKTDAFPVDTWIEKLYREDFNGAEKNRNKINEFFVNTFGEDSGYIQQYVFYYKRSIV